MTSSALRRLGRRLADLPLSFVLPSTCPVCRGALRPLQTRGACTVCWLSLDVLRPPLCPSCGLPRPDGTDLFGPARGRCAACLIAPGKLARVRAAVVYDDVARAILLRAKLGRREELLAPVGRQLLRVIELDRLAATCDLVLPVPSHPWTTLRRGFSPAAVIAGPVARGLGLPCRRLLRRRWVGPTSSKRLPLPVRRARAGALRLTRRVTAQRILLVDDVMTTGATACACARKLLDAGAREVVLAVWARTLLGTNTGRK